MDATLLLLATLASCTSILLAIRLWQVLEEDATLEVRLDPRLLESISAQEPSHPYRQERAR